MSQISVKGCRDPPVFPCPANSTKEAFPCLIQWGHFEKADKHLQMFSMISILSGAIHGRSNPTEANPIHSSQSGLHQWNCRDIPDSQQYN